jgi:hypothetical protein
MAFTRSAHSPRHNGTTSTPRRPALCHSNCANLAYTDRDIAEHRRRLPILETEARDPMTPRPRRDRAAAQAARICAVIEQHETSRPVATHMEGGQVA